MYGNGYVVVTDSGERFEYKRFSNADNRAWKEVVFRSKKRAAIFLVSPVYELEDGIIVRAYQERYEVLANGTDPYPYEPMIFDTLEDAEYQVEQMIVTDGYKAEELEIERIADVQY